MKYYKLSYLNTWRPRPRQTEHIITYSQKNFRVPTTDKWIERPNSIPYVIIEIKPRIILTYYKFTKKIINKYINYNNINLYIHI